MAKSASVGLPIYDAEKIIVSPSNSKVYLETGKIYTAYEKGNRYINLKCIITGTTTKNDISSASKEMKIMFKCQHKNIVQFYGMVRLGDYGIGLVFEHMKCGILGDLIKNKNIDLSWPLRLRISVEVASALKYLHSTKWEGKAVVYGDLCAEKCYLDEDVHVKLGDFGCANIVQVTMSPQESPKRTEVSVYQAPEIIENPFLESQPSSDMYSYAMLLYHIALRFPAERPRGNRRLLDEIKGGWRPPVDNLEMVSNRSNENDQKIIAKISEIMRSCWEFEAIDRWDSHTVKRNLEELLIDQEEKIYENIGKIKTTISFQETRDFSDWIPFVKSLK